MLHGKHHLTVFSGFLCLGFYPAQKFIIIGYMLLPVNIVAYYEQSHVIGKLCNIRHMLLVEFNSIGIAEVFVIAVKIGKLCSFGFASAFISEAERIVVKIVTGCNNIDLFAALFSKLVKKF